MVQEPAQLIGRRSAQTIRSFLDQQGVKLPDDHRRVVHQVLVVDENAWKPGRGMERMYIVGFPKRQSRPYRNPVAGQKRVGDLKGIA